jgi:hypothetical protein
MAKSGTTDDRIPFDGGIFWELSFGEVRIVARVPPWNEAKDYAFERALV